MKYQKLINESIKKLRQSQNLTQEEFAEKVGISLQGLSNIERNRYQPNSETIDKICKVFKLTPIELLTLKNDGNKEIIINITALLSQCSKARLNKIYDILYNLIIEQSYQYYHGHLSHSSNKYGYQYNALIRLL